ncbi:MAG TPA: DUF2249 domain-containing protein [Streptosporangiaceae bacterium]|nr:DUF2249 domain-containing protein [Streptosporangiaceae bacterium]
MTMTEAEALDAILAHHRALNERVSAGVTALAAAVTSDGHYEQAAAGLVAYLGDEVLPHAQAEEDTIYRAAAARRGLAGTVAELTAEHAALTAAAERLADAPDGPSAMQQAEEFASLFARHAAKENDTLLPALIADGHDDLPQLLERMHDWTEAAHSARVRTDSEADPSPRIVSLLLTAAGELARVGEADQACKLAASAWAVLRGPQPDLAAQVTAALHKLIRHVDTTPGAALPTHKSGHHGTAMDPEIDVRRLPPAHRHQTIFDAYQALKPGAGFVLINDHDPKPLHYQFQAECTGKFTWDYLETGPSAWRVRIGRATPHR